MKNELYHHGIKGMKWGIRRYQNKDGSLTPAGRKRATKLESEYSTLTGKKISEKTSDQSSGNKGHSTGSKSKSISEMSNQEIQDKIDRIRLENTLKSLTPQQTTRGERFVNSLKDSAISIIKDKGTKITGDYIDKQLRNKLGLSNKDAKTAAQILQEEAQKYENRQKIDRGQQYFKEGKYAEKKTETNKSDSQKNDSNNRDSKTETWSGTVEREGTSKKKNNDWQNTKSRGHGDPIDVEWREVNDESINRGQTYVSQLLLEDKKYR